MKTATTIVAALLAHGAGVQDGAQRSAADVLEALIAQTNALSSFEAEYSLEAPDVGTATIRMLYRAPHDALLHMSGAKGELWMVFRERVWELRSRNPDGGTAAGTIDPRPGNELLRRIDAKIAEGFPALQGKIDAGAAPQFAMSAKWNEETGRHDADIRLLVQHVAQDRLAYLSELAQQAPQLELGEKEIVLRGELGLETAVDRTTGFLTRMLDTSKEHAGVRLVELRTGVELPDARFEVPARTSTAKNVDAGLEHIQDTLVRAIRERLYTQLPASAEAWTTAQTAAVTAAFELYHREMVARGGEKLTQSWLAWNQQVADHVRGQLASPEGRGDPAFRKRLKQSVAETRTKLVEAMTAGVDSYYASYTSPPPDAARDAIHARIAVLDRAAAKSAFMAVLATPLFQDFDERVVLPGD